MAKSKKPVIETSAVETGKTFLEDLSREELSLRYKDNVARRQELAEENKVLAELYKKAGVTEKSTAAAAKIAALQARLDALKNPSPKAEPVVTPEVAAEIESLAL
jgi:hypothetical protein